MLERSRTMLEKIRQINFRGKNAKVVYILLLLSVASYFFYFRPSWEALQVVNEEITLLREETEEAFIFTSQSKKRLEELKELETDIARLESRVPPSGNLPVFFAELEGIILNSGPRVQNINISEISPPEDLNYRFFTIDVNFISSRQEMLSYIKDIENFARVLQVEQLTFRREEENYSGSMRIRAFLSI